MFLRGRSGRQPTQSTRRPQIETLTRRDLLAADPLTDSPAGSVRDEATGADQAGQIQSVGDTLMQADRLRQRLSAQQIDGSGVRIGVISDGVDHAPLVGGELPAIAVNPELPGSGDQGTAVLEILHDVAPRASLHFSSGTRVDDFLRSVDWLLQQEVDIIVSDVTFLEEPYFEDGVATSKVQQAVDAGVLYVAAAGNSALQHYQAMADAPPDDLHDFDPGPDVDNVLDAVVLPEVTVTVSLQWSDPFGGSGNDYDLIVTDADFEIIAVSEDIQDGDDDPIEALSFQNTSGEAQLIQVMVRRGATAEVRELELFTRGADIVDGLHVAQDSVIAPAMVPGALVVGAVNAADAEQGLVAPYSSRGPATIYTDFETQTRLARPVLDGVAIDGIETRVGLVGHFPFQPFFGTSAAATHAAGIAALLLQARPDFSAERVVQVLTNSASDIGQEGVDLTSGHGLLDAWQAMLAARLWQNDEQPLDVNNDGFVTPVDNLLVINSLNAHGSRALPDEHLPLPPVRFLDVNGDNFISPVDALRIMSHLNRPAASPGPVPDGTGNPASLTPAPSGTGRSAGADRPSAADRGAAPATAKQAATAASSLSPTVTGDTGIANSTGQTAAAVPMDVVLATRGWFSDLLSGTKEDEDQQDGASPSEGDTQPGT
jgi:hypothetical protein